METAHARVIRRIVREHFGLVELAYIIDIDERRVANVAADM